MHPLHFAGTTLLLHPQRAALWPDEAVLIVADVHWGKAATFRHFGIPVPPGGTADDLARLDALLTASRARHLVVLGDLFHARSGRTDPRTHAQLAAWRATHPALDITLVRGNHDRRAGDPAADLDIRAVDAPYPLGPFTLAHEPLPRPGAHVIAGHLHPGLRLAGPGRQRERLPCFVEEPGLLILPAFGGFTGLALVDAAPDRRRFAVADTAVVEA